MPRPGFLVGARLLLRRLTLPVGEGADAVAAVGEELVGGREGVDVPGRHPGRDLAGDGGRGERAAAPHRVLAREGGQADRADEWADQIDAGRLEVDPAQVRRPL